MLPDGLALPERLTGRELLRFMGQLRGLPTGEVERRSAELLAVLDLDQAERTLVLDYSTGMRKKVGLAVALLHAPRLLVLDEPFEAVDPLSAATIRAILRRFVAAGGSVVLSSHVMALVERRERAGRTARASVGSAAGAGHWPHPGGCGEGTAYLVEGPAPGPLPANGVVVSAAGAVAVWRRAARRTRGSGRTLTDA
ncbi:hypothetical protein GCM10010430_50400 [Kitasatospora cystarginea]|uniref:ATPase AAA-type core domain-containing protein n=1 Tax=Kitasatospora cystarginea TaxID=58350 RepID=A0ABN3EJ81_9ACTN